MDEEEPQIIILQLRFLLVVGNLNLLSRRTERKEQRLTRCPNPKGFDSQRFYWNFVSRGRRLYLSSLPH
jgi:hypothetical protein